MSESTNWEARFHALAREVQDVGSDMGIYPKAMQGYNDERDYKERDGYKNGWNAAVMQYGNAITAAGYRAVKDVDSNLQLLLAADVGSLVDGQLELNMNDTWAWACSDSEPVPVDELPEVARLFRAYGRPGLLYWVSKRNEWMRSAFHDINRFIDFVRNEEDFCQLEPSSSKRAYTGLSYTLAPTTSGGQS